MPDEKKGLIATIKERWAKFRGAGAQTEAQKRKTRPRRVDLSRAYPPKRRKTPPKSTPPKEQGRRNAR